MLIIHARQRSASGGRPRGRGRMTRAGVVSPWTTASPPPPSERRELGMYECSDCGSAACCAGEEGPFPGNCPTAIWTGTICCGPTRRRRRRARASGRARGGQGYCRLTRIEEIMDFARRCGYSRLGLAHCIGLQDEAAVVKRVFEANGLADGGRCLQGGGAAQGGPRPDATTTRSRPASSRACATRSDRRGSSPRRARSSTSCSGCAWATTACSSSTRWRPVTVLAAKDRVLGHNPLAAVYQADGYYHDRLFPTAKAVGERRLTGLPTRRLDGARRAGCPAAARRHHQEGSCDGVGVPLTRGARESGPRPSSLDSRGPLGRRSHGPRPG